MGTDIHNFIEISIDNLLKYITYWINMYEKIHQNENG